MLLGDDDATSTVVIDVEPRIGQQDLPAARPRRCAQSKLVGYARTLLDPADVRTAVGELQALGVTSEHLHIDHAAASQDIGRPRLQDALESLQRGDTMQVASLVRLARSFAELTEVVDVVTAREAHLRVGADPLDVMERRELLRLAARFEAEVLEWALADDAWLAAHPRTRGRGGIPRLSPMQVAQLRVMFDAQRLPVNDLGRLFGISRASVYRLAAARAHKQP